MAIAQDSRSTEDLKADSRRHPHEILVLSGIKPGMAVVDLLGGDGYYSELFNPLVGPGGTVFLQNNSLFLRFSTEGLEKRLHDGRLANVSRLDSEFADLMLPVGVDLIFMGLSYHDIYVPREDPIIMTSREEFFPQIWRALKPGGRLLIIDHAAEPGSGNSASPKLHRIAEDYARADIQSAGFRLVAESDVLRNPNDDYSKDIWNPEVSGKTDRFVLVFERPEHNEISN
jgi:predicted methyltransferase